MDDPNKEEKNRQRRLRVLDEKRHVTSRLSENIRYIGFGLLAIYYTIKFGDAEFAKSLRHLVGVAIIGVSGAAAVTLDYAQYLFATWAVDEALDNETAEYNKKSWWYGARELAFQWKQLAAAVGAASLILLLVSAR